MTRSPFRMRRTTTAALILLAACSADAVAGRIAAQADARYQETADRAALAGVAALAATDGQPEPERIEAARRAAEAVMAQAGVAGTATAVSPAEMRMQVSLVSKGGTPLQAAARYVAPGEAVAGRRDARIAARRF